MKVATDPVPRSRTAWSLAVTVLALLVIFPGRAAAAPGITVSASSGLNPAGDTITVRGSGFDVTKGIYVAVCVDNGPGKVPTPCLGGADTSGGSGGSAWISSNPPSYGVGLATPYGPGGSFSVTLSVVAKDPVTGTDCTKVGCAAVTRADHTRTSDRSQDTRIRLTFAAPKPRPAKPKPTAAPKPATTTVAPPATTTTAPTTTAPTTTTTPTTATDPTADPTADIAVGTTAATTDSGGAGWWLGGGAAVVLAAAVLLLRRRRRGAPDSPTD